MRNALRTGFDKSVFRPGRCKTRRPRQAVTPLTYDQLLDQFEIRLVANLRGAH